MRTLAAIESCMAIERGRRGTVTLRRLASCLLAIPAFACAPEGPSTSTTMVRDSSGVQIIENSGEPSANWEIVEPHRLEIGVTMGEAAYQLSGVRSVRRLSHGTIVIADSGSRELRFFDAQGQFLRSVGGRGSGPGEYEMVTSVSRFRGDSLIVLDSRVGRITVLDARGGYVRDWSLSALPEAARGWSMIGGTEHGYVIVRRTIGSEGDPSGYHRMEWEYALVAIPSESVMPLDGVFLSGEIYEVVSFGPAGMTMTTEITTLPFSRSTFVAAGSSQVYIGMNDRYEIHVYSADGTLSRIIRRSDSPLLAVDDDAIEWYLRAATAAAERAGRSSDLEAARSQLLAFPRVPALPVFAELIGDLSDNLWIKRYIYPWISDDSEAWDVFNADGVLQAFVTHPEGLRIHEIGEDYVLGVVTDELGVERVRLYDLVRSN